MNVHQIRSTHFPFAVFAVLRSLRQQAEPTLHEIAHDIETKARYRLTADDVLQAVRVLRDRGNIIREHDDLDGIRYELIEPQGAA